MNRFFYKHEEIKKGDVIFYSFNSYEKVIDIEYNTDKKSGLNPRDSIKVNGNEVFIEDIDLVVRWKGGYDVFNYAPRRHPKKKGYDYYG